MLLAPGSVLHDEAPRLAERGVVGIEGGADRAPAVAGGWLHVHFLERGLAQDAAIRHAVPRHAEQNLLGHGLDAGGDVGVVPVLARERLIVPRFLTVVGGVTTVEREEV